MTESSDNNMNNTPLRRATRVRHKPKKFGDFMEVSPTKRKSHYVTSSEDEEMMEGEERQPKPTALFSNDDVEGQDMFHFKLRHTKHDIHNKVKEAISTSPKLVVFPKTTKTALQNLKNKTTKATPRQVKNIIKKYIISEIENDSSQSDFSGGSSSDFVPDESDNETQSSHSPESSEDDDESLQRVPEITRIVKNKSNAQTKDSEYFITPDNYFMMHSNKKITTSDHTLSRLKNLTLHENEVHIQISQEHKNRITDLNMSYKHLFNRWLYVLSENFNIILHGVGSKRKLVNQFQAEKLKEFPCVVVNGFFPSLTIKSVLESIVIDLLENTNVPSNLGDAVQLIKTQLNDNGMDLFLIVHNIDGEMLRNSKAQATLSSLSQIRNVHMIATVDHINAPLLWDQSKLSKLKFTWWDVTTFLPYLEETSFENSLMTHRSGALQLSSLKSVHQSLTTNAKGIFNIIIEYQLENQKNSHYQGLPFKDLYSKCREQFLVSSDLALRAQLTEFLDHKLVKMKRSYDGSENLVIPIETTLLQQFLEQNS